ncbi:MAG: hypothetical protein KA158_02005 [Leucobacter sp.]|nr:hypothetical protein [Leucobacter sp.]
MTAALALSALIGLAMPTGETMVVSANATAATSAVRATLSESSQESPSAPPPAADTPAPDATVPETPAPVTPDTPPPGEDAPGATETPEAVAPDAADPEQAPGAYRLTWSVRNAANALQPGATVRLEGPRASGGANASWGSSRTVPDCTRAPCAATSMDQDPTPGVFVVDRLVSGSSVTLLTEAAMRQRFRITPLTAPSGNSWTSPASREIPALSSGQQHLPSPNPWASPTYDFGVLRVQQIQQSGLSCEVDNLYSMSADGQMKHVTVDPGRTSGVVANIGPKATSTGNPHFNGLAIGPSGTDVYAFNRLTSDSRVYKFDVRANSWSETRARINIGRDTMLIAGAVDPVGTYWAGGYTASNALDLWAMSDDGLRMERRGRVDLSEWASSNGNGDFSFDSEGNLYIARGLNVGTDLDIFRVDAADLAGGTGTELIPVSGRLPTVSSPFQAVSGIAYDSRGALFIGGGDSVGIVTLPATEEIPRALTLRGTRLNSSDLAACGFPPTVKLQKELPEGRAKSADQFKLEMKVAGETIGEAQTSGGASGVQPDAVGPVPVTSGAKVELSESAVGGASLAGYASSWSCVAAGEEIAAGQGSSGSVTIPEMPRGSEVLCTIRNTPVSAQKAASPESGTVVEGGSVVRYDLTLDNSAGEGPVVADYWDALSDVLDDAVFVDSAGNPTASQRPDVVTSGGITFSAAQDWDPQDKWLRMRGSIAAGDTGTLSFSVRVLPNAQDAEAREGAKDPQGYFLRNRLVRGTGGNTPPAVPKTCEPGLCTEHPVSAWTVSKDSLPTDGALLYKGGNVFYKVTAEKLNAEAPLAGLVLQDDLTHVFKSAGWAPGATPPAGALSQGLYLFNASGRSVGLDGAPNTGSAGEYSSVRDLAQPEERNIAPGGAPEDRRWILSSGEELNLPAEAVRAEMWFAVQAGESPAGIPDPGAWTAEGKTPVTGWQLVNYATGSAQQISGDFDPNACVTGTDVPNTALAPDADPAGDDDFPAQCQVRQQLSQNSFTIRKDAGGLGVAGLAGDPAWGSDTTGLWDMVGQQFEIRDSVNGKPSAYPSVQLCRTDYDPAKGWNGDWVSPAAAADASRWDFGDGESATQRAILDWNNANPGDTRPVCGTVSESGAGAQTGRWLSEGLGAGDYWLVETKAPNAQISQATLERRPVPGVQKLAEAIPFTVWPEANGPTVGGGVQGRGQLEVGHSSGSLVERCDTASAVADRPTACVDPAGYFMVVKDPAPAPLPLTGGQWLALLGAAGALVLLGSLAAIVWHRRRAAAESQVA